MYAMEKTLARLSLSNARVEEEESITRPKEKASKTSLPYKRCT